MRSELIRDVCAQLARERHIISYYKDRYASMLLDWATNGPARIGDLRKTRFAPLLEKPAIKAALATRGDGRIDPKALDCALMDDTMLTYRLSFGRWPEEDGAERYVEWQRSRRGYSIVVQLNFTGEHDEVYNRQIDPHWHQYLACLSHPVTKEKRRNTLAWARVDFDPDKGEALIEEIQTDWVRYAKAAYHAAQFIPEDKRGNVAILGRYSSHPVMVSTYCRYYEEVLAPHLKVWSEAVLAATLAVMVDMLSIRQIWMFGVETGNRLKGLEKADRRPPVSLYKDLPRRFCFEETTQTPTFLRNGSTRKTRQYLKSGEARFWRHQF